MRSFRRLTVSTLLAVYLLILVGGIVRGTGSGMGCPDWPKCFGQWVPPTSISELPADYKIVYAAYREKKNIRFARYLDTFGFHETAMKIITDPAIKVENTFNPVKTWIEYINRVIGVIIGFLIFGVFIFSLKFWNKRKRITWVAGITLVLVALQGWIGSFVVSTNLTPWTVTVHMFLALVIVALLTYLIYIIKDTGSAQVFNLDFWWLVAAIGVILVQILMGTQVREAVDQLPDSLPRDQWIANLPEIFLLHRSFSWLILILHAGFVIRNWRREEIKTWLLLLCILLVCTMLTGIGMAYLSIPAFLQPLHLVFASGTFGVQFYLLFVMTEKRELIPAHG